MKSEGRGTPHQSPAATASPRGSLKAKKRICAWVGLLCLAVVIFLVGGADRGWAPMSALWWAAACEAVGAAAWWKAGVIRI